MSGSYIGFASGLTLMTFVDVGSHVPVAAVVAMCIVLSAVFALL